MKYFSYIFLIGFLFNNSFSQKSIQINVSRLPTFQNAGLNSLNVLRIDTPIHYYHDMDEIVVSATRWNERAGNIPMKISTICNSGEKCYGIVTFAVIGNGLELFFSFVLQLWKASSLLM